MFQGWWIVGTHFTAQLFMSGFFVYALPLLFAPLIEEFDTDATTLNSLASIAGLLGLVVAPVAGPLVDRWSARWLLVVGTVCLIVGLLGLSVASSIWGFVAIGALFFGVSNTLMGPMTGSAVISRWFVATRGRALGIASIGTSVGGILMSSGLAFAINSVGWRMGLRGLAALVSITVLPALLFRFWDSPTDRGVGAEGSDAPVPPSSAKAVSDGAEAGPEGAESAAAPAPAPSPEFATTREILTTPAFWLFTVTLALFLGSYVPTLNNLGQYYADLEIPVTDAGFLIGLLAASGIAGKLAFGMLADHIPLKAGLWFAIGLTAGGLYLFSTEPAFKVVAVAAAMLGFATGGILPVWNAMVPAIFGVENFGRTMGLMSPVISIAITPSFLVVGMIRDASGSYVGAFHFFIGVLLVAALILIPLRVERLEFGS